MGLLLFVIVVIALIAILGAAVVGLAAMLLWWALIGLLIGGLGVPVHAVRGERWGVGA